jgi:flagellar hook-length control protein FliK
MNPLIPQLTTSGRSKDQSTSQGVSKNIGKSVKGKNVKVDLADLTGGAGSFVSVLRQKSTVSTIEKNHSDKELAVNPQEEADTGHERIESRLSGVNSDLRHVFRKGMSGEAIPFGESGTSQFIIGEGNIRDDNVLNLSGGGKVGDGAAGQIKFTEDKELKLSLKMVNGRFGSLEKLISEGTNHAEGETNSNLGTQLNDSLKGNKIAKKNVSEEMSIFRSGDARKDHTFNADAGISQGFDVKESSIKKVSSDVKGHELKNDSPMAETKKDTMISANQVNRESEKIQNYKNYFSEGLASGKSIEKEFKEIPAVKTDTSQVTAQADLSGIKGVWNGSVTNMKGDVNIPLQFQDVMNQITDSASNILKKGSGRIVITLDPPNLGTLNMDIRVQNDTVRMLLVADNKDVKQILHSNLDQLKTALQGQGLSIDRFDVLVQDRQYDGNPGFQPGGGTLFEDGRRGRNNTSEDNASLQIRQSAEDELNEPSLGIISLFV